MIHPMTRRLGLLAAAALGVLLLTAASAQAMTMEVDVANVVSRLAYGAASLAGAGLLWLGKRGLDALNRMEAQLTVISHELFGATGANGMRSDVKDAKRMLRAHTRVIAVLADREGIDFNEDDPR